MSSIWSEIAVTERGKNRRRPSSKAAIRQFPHITTNIRPQQFKPTGPHTILAHPYILARAYRKSNHGGGANWYAIVQDITNALLTSNPVLDGGTGFLKAGYAGQVRRRRHASQRQ